MKFRFGNIHFNRTDYIKEKIPKALCVKFPAQQLEVQKISYSTVFEQ